MRRATMRDLLLGLPLLLPAVAAHATLSEATIDGWTVKPFVIDGKFDRCNANAPTRDLAIVLFADGRYAALVADPAAARQDAQIDVEFDFDGGKSRPISATVVTDQLFLVALGKGDPTADQLSKAKTLHIKAPDKSYSFDVSRLGGPLAALKRCVAGSGKFDR